MTRKKSYLIFNQFQLVDGEFKSKKAAKEEIKKAVKDSNTDESLEPQKKSDFIYMRKDVFNSLKDTDN